ncbi:MAG: MATE family efflux transporter [bacterium]|nr:MATE family efflux transporter [bacterium]
MAKLPSFDRSITEGPIPSAVWKVAWPTLLQNLFAGIQGVVDHVMVGHYVGFEANAAIGVSWQIFLVVVIFVSSLYSGMGVLVARFAGAGDSSKVNRVVYQVFLASTGLGLLFIAPVGYLLAPRLLDLVNAAPGVQDEALPYLRIMFVFSLGMMHFFMFGGALRAAGDARTPMRLGIMLTVANLVLNVILIRGLGPIPAFGTRGAAMGTVIAAGLVSLAAFYLLFTGKLVVRFEGFASWKPDWPIISEVIRFGLPTGFQGIAMNVGGVLMIRYVGALEQSAEAQAAFAVGYTQLFSLITWTSTALLAASATVAGQNLGAEKPDRAATAPRSAAYLGLFLAVPMGLLFLIAPRLLLGIFGMEDPIVLGLGRQLLAFLSLSGVFLTVALSYTGGLQGTGDTKSPFYISLVSQVILPLGICAVIDATRGLHPADIWFAIVLGHFVRCALSLARFQQGKWREIEVKIAEA